MKYTLKIHMLLIFQLDTLEFTKAPNEYVLSTFFIQISVDRKGFIQ